MNVTINTARFPTVFRAQNILKYEKYFHWEILTPEESTYFTRKNLNKSYPRFFLSFRARQLNFLKTYSRIFFINWKGVKQLYFAPKRLISRLKQTSDLDVKSHSNIWPSSDGHQDNSTVYHELASGTVPHAMEAKGRRLSEQQK